MALGAKYLAESRGSSPSSGASVNTVEFEVSSRSDVVSIAHYLVPVTASLGFPGGSAVKNPPAIQET